MPTVYLNEYQAPTFNVEHINLTFDIHETYTNVTNDMRVQQQTPGALLLNGDDLELVSVAINERVLGEQEYQIQEGNLWLPNCPEQFNLSIITKIYPAKNTALSGLFCSNKVFCTQCEAEGFRRMTFFPDRPDVLTLFTTKIIADKANYPVLLSNGNLLEKGDLSTGRHWAIWQDPFKKPCYLFALVAGDLIAIHDTYTTGSGKKVDLSIYVEKGNEDKCEHAMASLKKAMQWDEKVYGREYDLSIYMIVAVNDFNMGAMENKGLNIFNSKYILARPDTATDEDFAHVEGVVAHEYFHNWTGNRVTCRDWFQLSLKEGLTVFRDQEFSRDMNSRDVNRILDVELLKNTQFPEDASSMAHPVRPESYQEINNFYTATIYNKGAEVIRMQHTLLGPQGFRRGMDLYFERHDGQAVTIDDFIAAMEDANHVDFKQFSRWYSQAGTPTVDVESHYENNTLTLTLRQSGSFHIPIAVALFGPHGQQIPLEKEILELRQEKEVFSFKDLPCQPVISLLRDFSAPIKLKYTLTPEEKRVLLRYETNGYAQWNAAQSLALSSLHSFYDVLPEDQTLDAELITAFEAILADDRIDPALKALIVSPPSFEDVIADIPLVDVNAMVEARDHYRRCLGIGLWQPLKALYLKLWAHEDHGMHAEAYARRQLRNTCLQLLMQANEAEMLENCWQQFTEAKTMTDQLASFKALSHSKAINQGQQASEMFYQQWAGNELVLDKWFAIQASSELPDTLTRVRSLMQHPAFSLKNPNKVRSLVGVFSMANPRHFHAADGSGYAFLTEVIATLDKINPQIAARLLSPFTRWRCFDTNRQQLITAQLSHLSSLKLSRDLHEVVAKSLP